MKILFKAVLGMAAAALLYSRTTAPGQTLSGLSREKFVSEINGKATDLYTLTNADGMEVCVTNFGGRIVSIMVPDRDGKMRDVLLGFDNIANYADKVNTPSDFGASIGRYANRINKGLITIDGETIQLPQNNFAHCLHGGPDGWQYQVYDAVQPDESTVVLTMNSPDGDSNFPGTVKATVTMKLTDDNAIDISYEAVTDKKTVINMTNHAYFNLSGDPTRRVDDHIMHINADTFTPVDSTFMTTGEITSVEGTPMDFRQPAAIGQNIKNFEFEQVKFGNGFDHNWCLNTAGDDTQIAARVYCPETGICLEVLTDEPGIQFYSGNFLNGSCTGKGGIVYNQSVAFCLETQKYPDTPNKPEWPSAFLEPGQKYTSHCVYRFSTVE